jgi:alcohol dehydrogenase
MRAVQLVRYGPPSQLGVVELPMPEPRAGQVRVRVVAAAINPIDAKIRAGALRAVIRPRLPFVPGMDVAGVIDSVGPGAARFKPGDEVYGSPSHKTQGALAGFVCVSEKELALKPRSIGFQEAASLPLVALTAWDALVRHARLQRGQSVLIQAGAGGVGTIAIQLARHLGAKVFTTCGAANAELVRSLGADVVIDHRTQDYVEVARGCDVVIDAFAGEHLHRAIACVRPGGTVIMLASGLPDATKLVGPYLGVALTGLKIAGFALKARLSKGARCFPINRRPDGETLATLARLVDEGVLRPVIDSVFPLEQIALAHERLETGRCRGKVVVAVG